MTSNDSWRAEPGAPDELPRRLFDTDVVLQRTRGVLRLTMPGGDPKLLLSGIGWIALLAFGFWEPLRNLVPLVLILVLVPGTAMAVTGGLRLFTQICFELGPARFVASGLGYFRRTTKSWDRRDVRSIACRDTNYYVNDVRQVALVLSLKTDKEVVLVRSGDGLALGHIAVFLSKELQRTSE